MRELELKRVNADNQDLRRLIKKLDIYLGERYPESSIHSVDLDTADKDNVIFIVAYKNSIPVGCAALRPVDSQSCELKRMFVVENERGKGYSKIIYEEIESIARNSGYRELKLETGFEQPEAIGLFKKYGYKRIPKFGEYINDPISVCFSKNLT
jgi:GNAT superfamily N-acetyltransferase